jgi:hypothetical protein
MIKNWEDGRRRCAWESRRSRLAITPIEAATHLAFSSTSLLAQLVNRVRSELWSVTLRHREETEGV